MSSTPAPAARVPHAIGLYLALVQALFALSWVVYVIYLPALVERAGLPRTLVPWLLMLDQLVFMASDLAVGLASDRAARVLGRLGGWIVAATLVSMAAFVALPWLAPGSGLALMALTLVWAASASVLRAPPLTLLGRYVARPAQPGLLALVMLGGGVAAALAPYLGLQLKALDPRVPFVLVSLALAAVTLGMVAAERALARSAGTTATAPTPAAAGAARPAAPALAGFLAAVALAALAFQLHANVVQAPLFLAVAPATELPWLLPMFWVGFNLALWPASVLARRWGAWPSLASGAFGAAAASGLAWACAQGAALPALMAAQALAGACWALLLVSAFSACLALGQGGHEGRASGALNAVLAGATLVRMATVVALAPTPATVLPLGWGPALGFAVAALLLWPRAGRSHGR
ncbi:MAG: MFS transporter [Burkholderiales bacterium]|nr:MFS transporter [Burkholderiales bacterium]